MRLDQNIILTYVWGYGPNQALVPIAESQKFPLIAVSAERSVSLHKKYTLRFCYHIEMIADELMKYIRAKGFKRIAIVKTGLAYFDGLLEFMNKKLLPGEGIEVIDTFQFDTSDFKAPISRLRRKTFDVLGVFVDGAQGSQIYREMKQINFSPPTFGTDFFDSLKLAKDAQGSMTGTVFAAPFVSSLFVERYVNEYGNDAQVAWAANAYEFALLAEKLFGNLSAVPSSEETLELLRSVRGRSGKDAVYTFNESPGEGTGFDFQVTTRRIEENRIVDASY